MLHGETQNFNSTSQSHREYAYEAIELMRLLTAVFLKRRGQLAAKVGLTEQEWILLERMQTEHFMPSMFAKERDSSPAAVSKILRRLMEKKIIEAQLSNKDSRKREYCLTAEGKKVMSSLREMRERAIKNIWMTFDEKTLSTFCDFGSRLIESIELYSQKEE